jgi:hypothetical protein
MNAEELKKKKE